MGRLPTLLAFPNIASILTALEIHFGFTMFDFYLMIIAILVVVAILGVILFFRFKMRNEHSARDGDDEAYVCSKLSDTLINQSSTDKQ